METTKFWELIDETRKAANENPKKQSDLLTEELEKLSANEIMSFQQIFYELKDKAYIGNLWDAATVIMNGRGDDGFQEFREWVVGRGKVVYENALNDPETLVDALEIGEQIYPTLLGPAMDAYKKVTGKDMPPMPREWSELKGRPTINLDVDETELLAELNTRFPKLTAKFWQWWMKNKIFLEVREILRELLAPLFFSEDEFIFMGVASFKRKPFTVEIMFNYDNFDTPDYSLYVSNEFSEKGYPIRQLEMNFTPTEYDEGKKRSIKTKIQEWIITVGV